MTKYSYETGKYVFFFLLFLHYDVYFINFLGNLSSNLSIIINSYEHKTMEEDRVFVKIYEEKSHQFSQKTVTIIDFLT